MRRLVRVLVLALLPAHAGCIVPILTGTPGGERLKFTLRDDEWGATGERLVIAGYRMRRALAGKPDAVEQWPIEFKVLKPDDAGAYRMPPKIRWSYAGWPFDLVGVRRQHEPCFYVFGARSAFGLYDPNPPTRKPAIPAPELAWKDGTLRWTAEAFAAADTVGDCLLGAILCECLQYHDPERRTSPHFRPHTAISRRDAELVAAYVAAHPKQFSRSTKSLITRLAEGYAQGGLNSNWYELQWEFRAGGPLPRMEQYFHKLSWDDQAFFQRASDGERASSQPATGR